MILYFLSLILGIIQGLTEFIPVSSSGHLILFQYLFKFKSADNLIFDLALHLGTFFALVIFFKEDILKYLKKLFESFKKFDLNDSDQRVVWSIIIASVPAAIIGFLFENIIEKYFHSLISLALALTLGGILFIIFEKISRQEDPLEKITFKKALVIGFSQALALVPGISRSGITIIAGLGINLNREAATKFSFLLSIPIIFGAAAKKLLDLSWKTLPANELLVFAVGFFSALIFGYFTIKYLLKYLKNHSLNIFAIYRFLLALIIILIVIFQ